MHEIEIGQCIPNSKLSLMLLKYESHAVCVSKLFKFHLEVICLKIPVFYHYF